VANIASRTPWLACFDCAICLDLSDIHVIYRWLSGRRFGMGIWTSDVMLLQA
jgi:hypothetical protein